MGLVEVQFRKLVSPQVNRKIFEEIILKRAASIVGPIGYAELLLVLSRALQNEIAVRTATSIETERRTKCILLGTPSCSGRGSVPWGENKKKQNGPDVLLPDIVKNLRAAIENRAFSNVRFHFPSRGLYRIWLRATEQSIDRIEGLAVQATRCRPNAGERCVKETVGVKSRCVKKRQPHFYNG